MEADMVGVMEVRLGTGDEDYKKILKSLTRSVEHA